MSLTAKRRIEPAPGRVTASANRLTSIVIATDFSNGAHVALNWASALARQHRARLTIVHAVDPAVHTPRSSDVSIEQMVQTDLDRAAASARLDQVEATTEYHVGRPWQVINDSAHACSADLVIVGTHGHGGLSRMVIGSTADRVIRTVNIPVMVVRPDTAQLPGAIRTILVATDFSEEASLATSMAFRLLSAAPAGGRIILLHAVALAIPFPSPDVPIVMPDYWDDADRTAKTNLETLAASLANERIEVVTKAMRGFAPSVIDEEARRNAADLVAMGTQGRGALNRFLLGSVAEHVLHHAPCPVLTVRRPEVVDPIQVSPKP